MPSDFKNLTLDNEEITKSLHELPLFKAVNDDILETLSKHSKPIKVEKNTTILEEGEINDKLYFLVDGSVDVLVGGEFVARLSKPGDLIGEMSVISSKPCSATNTTVEDSVLYCIDANELKSGSLANTELQAALYRIFSLILADKLDKTNQKARQFEATSRALSQAQDKLIEINEELEIKVDERTEDLKTKTIELEEQNDALTATNNKLEEVFSSKDQTFKRLGELRRTALKDLTTSFEKAKSAKPEQYKKLFESAARDIQKIKKVIDPLSSLHESEKAIKSKRVLLAENEKKQQTVAKMALGGTGVNLDIVDDVVNGRVLINENDYDVICTNAKLLSLAKLAHEKNPDVKTVFITSDDPKEYLKLLKEHDYISNIVTRQEGEKIFALKNIMTTVSKLISQEVFGLEKYLNWGVEVHERVVKSSGERRGLIDEMKEYLKALGVPRVMLEKCSMVAEELLMNIIWDAPVDETGKPIFNQQSRSIPVELSPDQRGTFRFACDGMLVAVSAEDPFGRLDRETILNNLDRCFNIDGRYESPEESGGGGLGIFQIMKTSNLVVYNVKKGFRTEVIALFNVKNITDTRLKTNSFHYFYDS